tara:strand:+ start:373 stop:879 length:507 start_codon:yes stop_codon:yes gene_type:complete
MIKYCDNFLTETELESLQEIMPGLTYTLEHYSPAHPGDLHNFQFVHYIVKNGKVVSPYFSLFENLFLDKLNITECQRMMVCVNASTHKVLENGYHKDWFDVRENDIMNSAIFYFNTCDGYTAITTKKGKTKKIESVENRISIFPAHWLHTGTTTSNSQVRTVLNIVYR